MNFETARNNMVLSQVRSWDVLDKSLLQTMLQVPREEFVPVTQRKLAFTDTALPIGHNQSMMKPIIEGRMLQAVALKPHETALEVGTGSGYVTALMARLCKHVTSIDLVSEFIDSAGGKLADNQIGNVTLHEGDFFDFHLSGRFDAVVLTGAVKSLPDAVFDWLNPGGRVFAIIGEEPIMQARVYTDKHNSTSYFDTVVDPLINKYAAKPFIL